MPTKEKILTTFRATPGSLASQESKKHFGRNLLFMEFLCSPAASTTHIKKRVMFTEGAKALFWLKSSALSF